LSGYTGDIQWQSSTTSTTSGFSNISSATTATYTANDLTTTTYFRARVKSGVCDSLFSNVVTVTVNPISEGGTLGGSTTVCTGSNSTLFTLSGKVGSVVKWQSSTSSSFTSATDIVNTTDTFTASNLTATTYYRAVVKNGVCATANSATGTVTVDPASVGGSIAGSDTVCYGSNNTTLTLSGHTGTIQWQSSTTSSTDGFSDINGATSQTLTRSNLNITTYYRAIVTSGVCASATSSVATITVDPLSVGGTITGSDTVCTGTNSTLLTLTGHTGSVQWQSSTTSASAGFANITGATANTYTADTLRRLIKNETF